MNLPTACSLADVFDCSLDELAGREWPVGYNAVRITPDEAAIVSDYRRMVGEDRETFAATGRALAFAGEAKKKEPVGIDALAGRDVRA